MKMRINGRCPMGCGDTLAVQLPENLAALATPVDITCEDPNCRNPKAVTVILRDDSPGEHIVELYDETFSIQHPLEERIYGSLFNCGMHAWLQEQSEPPQPTGRYRVRFGASSITWLPA